MKKATWASLFFALMFLLLVSMSTGVAADGRAPDEEYSESKEDATIVVNININGDQNNVNINVDSSDIQQSIQENTMSTTTVQVLTTTTGPPKEIEPTVEDSNPKTIAPWWSQLPVEVVFEIPLISITDVIHQLRKIMKKGSKK